MRLIIFTVIGFCSGLASILLTSRIGSTRPNIANGWELEIITSVVLGGVAITGGKGNIFGVVISIFIIGFLKFGMGLINVPGKVMNIIIGLLLILAIMLPELLKRLKPKNSFGKQICFHGGIDNQYVLPFGNITDVKNEVITCLETLANNKTGYILAPCHSIQPNIPIENIKAMYLFVAEYGKF